jgi:predicted  nucleic acid-binding Zn-ribbon protein
MAPPGKYNLTLKANGASATAEGEIKEVPLYETSPGQYQAFDQIMTEMERSVTEMHNMVNTLYKAQEQLKTLAQKLPNGETKTAANALLEKMKAWDEDMVQRKSQSYDDVENFPNKFTAEYLFLINQTNSSIQRVNASSIARKAELDQQWQRLMAQGKTLLNTDLPQMNKKLWEAGIGAIRI